MIMSFIKWIKNLFSTSHPVGCLLINIFSKAGRKLLKDAFDPETQRKAKEFVIELNADKTLSVTQKATKFNQMVLAWLVQEGKSMIQSQINLLRELAVNAVKVETKAAELNLDAENI